jgi:hypothetical protein
MRSYILFVFVLIPILFPACPKEPEKDSLELVSLDLRAAVPEGTEVNVPSDFAGMCHGGYDDNLVREYAMLDEMNVAWLHRDFSWSGIERTEGNFDFSRYDDYVLRAQAAGKKVMGMLLYDVGWVHTKHDNPSGRKIWPNEIPDFCNYAVKTVERYNGQNAEINNAKVDIWIIWNEPDLAPRFWSDPKVDPNAMVDFFALTKATAEAIRNLDREKGTNTALAGGAFTAIASDAWIEGFFEYEDGAIKDLLDGVAYHPYSPGPVSSASFVNIFKNKVAPYGFADKIWLNEMGYPTYSEKGAIPSGRYGTDQYEGDMPEVVAKSFALLAVMGARNVTWYHLFDRPNRKNNDSEDWFGLVWQKSTDDWIIKGGYWAYALCAGHLPGKTYKKLNFPGSVRSDIQTYYFEGDDGRRTLLVWNTSPLETLNVKVSFNGSNHQVWNVETGQSVAIDKTSTHTVHPVNKSQQTLLFFTWEN